MDELHDKVAYIVTTSTPRQVNTMVEDVARDANAVAAATVRGYVDAVRSGVAAIEGIHLRILRVGELWELPDVAFPASSASSASLPSFLDIAAEAAGEHPHGFPATER